MRSERARPEILRAAATTAGMTRRSLLGAAIGWSAVALGAGLSWVGCSDERARVAGAIRAQYPQRDLAAPVARGSGWQAEQALDVLLRSPLPAADGAALRAQLEQRIRDDFVADRMQRIDGRWLSDTEVAVAVVVAAAPEPS